MKLSVCIGILLMTFIGCKSGEENKQEFDTKGFFSEMDKLINANDKNFLSLEGEWKFSIGDEKEWASPNFNDKHWEEIKVPAAWENEGYHGYNGFAWYRKEFKIPEELKVTGFYLNLGYIDDIDETYVNGHLVGVSGGFPPEYVTAYNAERKYFVPNWILNNGENLIAVRVYDSQLDGGIIRGPVGISPVKPGNYLISDLELDINLRGTWKIETGDDSTWKEKNYNDSDWKKIFVPAYWETQGLKNYDGYAWYRTTFTLPEEFKDRKMVLVLGLIDDIDQTFLNGQLIGSIGDWNPETIATNFNLNNEWETFRGYYIPENILIPGKKNTIAVRVYDGYADGGIYRGPVGLLTQEKYRTVWKRNK